jgi:hypothetical protein
VQVLPHSISATDDETLKHIVCCIQKQLADSRQVPFLPATVSGLLDPAYQPRYRALHPSKSVGISTKFAALQQYSPRRKCFELFLKGPEFGQVWCVDPLGSNYKACLGGAGFQAFQPLTPERQLACVSSQRTV